MASKIPLDILSSNPEAADLEDYLSDTEFDETAASKAAGGGAKDRCVVVMGLPVVAANKVSRLTGVLKQIFTEVERCGVIVGVRAGR